MHETAKSDSARLANFSAHVNDLAGSNANCSPRWLLIDPSANLSTLKGSANMNWTKRGTYALVILAAALISLSSGLFEDQVGKDDWCVALFALLNHLHTC